MSSREIVLWLDERWYAALEKRLRDETLPEKLEDMLDELIKHGFLMPPAVLQMRQYPHLQASNNHTDY